jgi:glycerol-3-phosphate acyltransferase PlsY
VISELLTWIGLGVLAYAIGSIPTAYLVTRFKTKRDIRRLGDQNSGAANVFRNVGPKAGMGVGAVDIIKGGVAVLVVRGIADNTGMEMMAGIAALAGHNWPAHLKFRGGRGAATSVGVMIAMIPLIALPLGALGLVALYYTKRAIVALAMFLIAVAVLVWPAGYSTGVSLYALAIPLLVGLSHLCSTRIFAPVPVPGHTESPLPQE